MSEHGSQDDLAPTTTSGYKVSAKKTAAELAQLDAADESLRKWKESLGLKAGAGGQAAGPNVVVEALCLEVAGRPDVIVDLSSPEAISRLQNQVVIIKEGVEYRLKIRFRVNHEVISGLKYLHVVKRKGIKVDKMEEMVGSYGPSPDVYEKKFLMEEAPSGMIARGTYKVQSRFIDDDKVVHLQWDWTFEIKKEWD
ncbi:hypothetical protein HDV00_010421 [Rhizophlyctis rosea]|nr:hypothetical protein HDV00_010421 [Rhizophlyctis rosea]